MASVTFLGACGTVTGSATLLEWTDAHGGTRILVDCGLYQGGEELELRNWRELPFRAASLAAIVVTHAHLDHTGLLPRLVAEGYRGPILCSPPSRGLVALILEDSAALQEEAARYAAKKGYSRHPAPRPLYTANDARQTLRLIETVPFDIPYELGPGILLRLRRAGHLLGAASLELTAKGADGGPRTWCFSGDVGRYGAPILKDPEPPVEAPTALVLESTYGDRLHAVDDAREALATVVRRTFDRGGVVIIPAFALGRSQEVLYHLAALADRGVLDPDAVFLDSPMAIAATELYERAQSEHDEELAALVSGPGSPFAGESFHRCRRVEESKALNDRRAPAVIVAASGMAQGGRVVHHLKRRLGDPRATVLFIGYQAAGTRGRALLDGATVVAIHGQQVPVAAEIVGLHSLSAHADRAELLRWCDALPGRPQRTFLNHGEDAARKALAAALAERGWPRPELPQSGQVVPW